MEITMQTQTSLPMFSRVRSGEGAAANVTAAVTRGRFAPRKRKEGTTMDTLQVPLSNSGTVFQQLVDLAKELGAAQGGGKDAQTKFVMNLIEKAFEGVIDLAKDKHGKGRTDAFVLSEAYAKGTIGETVFDAKPDNQRKLLSIVTKAIRLGGCPKWGEGEPLGMVNTLMTVRQKLKQDPAYQGRINDAVNTIMKFATFMLKPEQKTPLKEAEMERFVLKPDPKEVPLEKVWENIIGIGEKLLSGDVPNCKEADTEGAALVKLAQKRLKALAKQRKAEETGEDEEDTDVLGDAPPVQQAHAGV